MELTKKAKRTYRTILADPAAMSVSSVSSLAVSKSSVSLVRKLWSVGKFEEDDVAVL
jgi:hypothetical protein